MVTLIGEQVTKFEPDYKKSLKVNIEQFLDNNEDLFMFFKGTYNRIFTSFLYQKIRKYDESFNSYEIYKYFNSRFDNTNRMKKYTFINYLMIDDLTEYLLSDSFTKSGIAKRDQLAKNIFSKSRLINPEFTKMAIRNWLLNQRRFGKLNKINKQIQKRLTKIIRQLKDISEMKKDFIPLMCDDLIEKRHQIKEKRKISKALKSSIPQLDTPNNMSEPFETFEDVYVEIPGESKNSKFDYPNNCQEIPEFVFEDYGNYKEDMLDFNSKDIDIFSEDIPNYMSVTGYGEDDYLEDLGQINPYKRNFENFQNNEFESGQLNKRIKSKKNDQFDLDSNNY